MLQKLVTNAKKYYAKNQTKVDAYFKLAGIVATPLLLYFVFKANTRNLILKDAGILANGDIRLIFNEGLAYEVPQSWIINTARESVRISTGGQ